MIAGAYTTRTAVALLHRLGIPVLELDVPSSVDEALAQITTVAAALGAPAKGAQLIADIRNGLSELHVASTGPGQPIAAVYQPNGFTIGKGSLVNDLLSRAGLRNLAVERRIDNYGALPLELLLFAQPDLLIINAAEDRGPAMAYEVLRHPALARRYPAHAWSACHRRGGVAPAHVWSTPCNACSTRRSACRRCRRQNDERARIGRSGPFVRSADGSVAAARWPDVDPAAAIGSIAGGRARAARRRVRDRTVGARRIDACNPGVDRVALPRTLLAVLVGASLGLAGAALQGLLRNPLAEPGIIGVSSCAAFGAVIAFYSGLSFAAPLALPLAGIAGA